MIRSKNRIFTTLAVPGTLLLVIAGCGGGGSTGPDSPAPLPSCSSNTYSPNYATATLYRWRGFPLRVWLAPASLEMRNAALGGFNQWVEASQNRVTYQLVSSESSADIVVKFDWYSGQAYNGVTYLNYSGKEMRKADMTLLFTSSETSNVNLAAHEFGHALGILDHSQNSSDLMYYLAGGDIIRPVTQRDVNTLWTAYCGSFPARAAGTSPSRAIRSQTTSTTIKCLHSEHGDASKSKNSPSADE